MPKSKLDPKVLESVIKKVSRKFPEIDGVKPKVRALTLKDMDAKDRKDREKALQNKLLIFNTTITTDDGTKLPRWVRVVISPKGRILKTTTSR